MTVPIQATPDELRTHAGHLHAVADGLDTARQAGESTWPGSNAYGQLCTMVPLMLIQLQAPLVASLAAAGASVRDTADAVSGVAGEYEYVDQNAAAEVRDSGGG